LIFAVVPEPYTDRPSSGLTYGFPYPGEGGLVLAEAEISGKVDEGDLFLHAEGRERFPHSVGKSREDHIRGGDDSLGLHQLGGYPAEEVRIHGFDPPTLEAGGGQHEAVYARMLGEDADEFDAGVSAGANDSYGQHRTSHNGIAADVAGHPPIDVGMSVLTTTEAKTEGKT
jgi:hypothetical protein